jgi:hypothetical protein
LVNIIAVTHTTELNIYTTEGKSFGTDGKVYRETIFLCVGVEEIFPKKSSPSCLFRVSKRIYFFGDKKRNVIALQYSGLLDSHSGVEEHESVDMQQIVVYFWR